VRERKTWKEWKKGKEEKKEGAKKKIGGGAPGAGTRIGKVNDHMVR
jgi:hypothetical protein